MVVWNIIGQAEEIYSLYFFLVCWSTLKKGERTWHSVIWDMDTFLIQPMNTLPITWVYFSYPTFVIIIGKQIFLVVSKFGDPEKSRLFESLDLSPCL